MEAYETLGILGEGTYGVVMKARNRATGKLVAIKRFKQTDEDEHVRKTSTREVRMLQQLKHPNVVRLEDVFRREGKLYLVFEYIDNTILQVLESTTRGIPPRELRKFIYQLLRGLEFCHAHNVIHRDVKPENVLIDQSGMLKLCDFGFARQMTSKGKYTDYVATRWYRAPELLVGDVSYGKPVDVWALGCMFAELSDGQPLFPGESDLDQLCLIIQTCGPVPDRMVSIFEHNPLYRNVSYPHTGIVYTLQERYHRQPEDWLEFLYSCLHPDPAKRLTCTELMALPYFTRDGFRERYEQELRAISGLPLLRTNPTGSAPSPTRRSTVEPPSGPKTMVDTTSTSSKAGAAGQLDAVGANNSTKAQKAQQQLAGGPKGDSNKHNMMDGPKTKGSDHATGIHNVSNVANTSTTTTGGSFLPAVTPPNAAATTETPVQLPMILHQSPEKTAAVEEVGQQSTSSQRRAAPQISPDTTASAASESAKAKRSRNEVLSQSYSAMLSSKRTSLSSSTAVSPVKKADNITMAAAYFEPPRRLSFPADRTEEGEEGRPAAAAGPVMPTGDGAAAAVVAAAVAATRGGGGSRRTSRSLYSNTSPRSTSLHSERGDSKMPASAAAPTSPHVSSYNASVKGAGDSQTGPRKLAAPAAVTSPLPTSNITGSVSNTHLLSKSTSGQQSLTPLAERLPDLSSPGLQLASAQQAAAAAAAASAAQDHRESMEVSDIPKPPQQSPLPASPTSFNNSAISPPSLNPLALPASHERGPSKAAAAAAVAKARRNGQRESDSQTTRKRLAKRKKDYVGAGGVGGGGRNSRGSSSRSTSHYSPQEQILECMRARGSNGVGPYEIAKQGSASVSAFKLSMPRSPSHATERSDSRHARHDNGREENAPASDVRADRVAGAGSTSGPTTPFTSSHNVHAASVKRAGDSRGSMPRKERRSKPLHATHQGTHGTDTQPPRQTDTKAPLDNTDAAQRASATLMALSALREGNTAAHPTSHDATYTDKLGTIRHHQGGEYGVVPLPPKTQAKDGASPAKKPSHRGRKPLGVYTLQSTRRSVDEGDGQTNPTALHVHDTNALASLPSSQYGGFAVPYRRTSKTGSNGGTSQPSLISQSPQQPGTKKSRKKRSSISGGDLSGALNPYTVAGTKEVSASPGQPSTALASEKSTPRRREESGGGNKKLLPVMYNAATAATTQL